MEKTSTKYPWMQVGDVFWYRSDASGRRHHYTIIGFRDGTPIANSADGGYSGVFCNDPRWNPVRDGWNMERNGMPCDWKTLSMEPVEHDSEPVDIYSEHRRRLNSKSVEVANAPSAVLSRTCGVGVSAPRDAGIYAAVECGFCGHAGCMCGRP